MAECLISAYLSSGTRPARSCLAARVSDLYGVVWRLCPSAGQLHDKDLEGWTAVDATVLCRAGMNLGDGLLHSGSGEGVRERV